MSKIDKDHLLNRLSEKVIGAAMEVHGEIGPGMLESAYETCLAHELDTLGIECQRQVALPLVYKGLVLEYGYRIDLLVESQLIIELKAVEKLTDIHKAQLLSYLKFSGCPLGLLINFNVKRLKNGIHRTVYNFQ